MSERPEPIETETFDKENALRLKAKIQARWEALGYLAPNVELEPAGFCNAARSARFDIRSDMVNGLPRKRVADFSETQAQ
jgi:hypothetical protein